MENKKIIYPSYVKSIAAFLLINFLLTFPFFNVYHVASGNNKFFYCGILAVAATFGYASKFKTDWKDFFWVALTMQIVLYILSLFII